MPHIRQTSQTRALLPLLQPVTDQAYLPKRLKVLPMNIGEIIRYHAAYRSTNIAVSSGNNALTFGAVADRASRLANALSGSGSTGRCIGVLATNTIEYIEIVSGIASSGNIWVPLNYRLTASELKFIIEDSICTDVIYTADMLPTVEVLKDSVSCVERWTGIGKGQLIGEAYDQFLARASSSYRAPAADPGATFSIMYTSGTTGKPKGAVLPHSRIFNGLRNLVIAGGARAAEKTLQIIPQFHAGGFATQFAQLMVGAHIVIANRFDPEQCVQLIQSENIRYLCLVPSMIIFLTDCPSATTDALSSLERIQYGGSPIPTDRLAKAMEIIRGGFQQLYGQTEIGVMATLLSDADHAHAMKSGDDHLLWSCGTPIMGYDVEIRDADANILPVGQVGEICVRGESTLARYHNLPEATAQVLRDGRLNTGDLGYRDENGYFYLVDRKVDLIVSGGENVYPAEVENVISAHPDILEAAVIGVPDERWGEAVKGIVVPRGGKTISEAELITHCRKLLAGYKCPKSIDLIYALPRTPSGKVKKHELREQYWKDSRRRIA
jgi:long-chain acyl-CoA synthetase